jgi:arylsulfatase A-like enzyme
VIVTADHGESLGEHGVHFHGRTTWEPIVRVPAIFVAPTVVPGTYDGLVTHRDIPSTILGVFGASVAEGDGEVFGRSWLRLRREPRPDVHRFVVTRSDRVLTLVRGASVPQAAIIEGDLKLTKTFEDGLREMYDLRADPGEERDVEPMRAGEAGALEHQLERYRDLDVYP